MKARWMGIMVLLVVLLTGCSDSSGGKAKEEEKVAMLTEDEIIEITGDDWLYFSDKEKLHAVNSFIAYMTENEDWEFPQKPRYYIDRINEFYDGSSTEIQFASAFITIHTIDEESN